MANKKPVTRRASDTDPLEFAVVRAPKELTSKELLHFYDLLDHDGDKQVLREEILRRLEKRR